jgi:hypothetical protein
MIKIKKLKLNGFINSLIFMEIQETEVCNIWYRLYSDKEVSKQSIQLHKIHCERNTVKCPSCNAKMNRMDLEKHKDEVHAPKKCEKCSKEFEIQYFDSHDCPKKPMLCTYCEAYFPADQFRFHNIECGNRTDQCPKCKEFIRKKVFKDHLTKNNCSPPAPKIEFSSRPGVYESGPDIESFYKRSQREEEEEKKIVSRDYQPKKNEIRIKSTEENKSYPNRPVKPINPGSINESKNQPVRPVNPVSSTDPKNQLGRSDKPNSRLEESKKPKGFNNTIKDKPTPGSAFRQSSVSSKASEAKKPSGPSSIKNIPRNNPQKPSVSPKIEPKVKRPEIDDFIPQYEDDEIPYEVIERSMKDSGKQAIQKIESKERKLKIQDYELEDDLIDEIPYDFLTKDSKKSPIFQQSHSPEPEFRSSENLLEDEEQIVRAVLEESKKDNFGLSEEERMLNEMIFKSLKEK